MINLHEAAKWFSLARSENNKLSVYENFVIPHDIEKNNLLTIRQSIVLVGGRGIGKTAYLRYFSHWTQFDKNRNDVSTALLDTVILYWKPDTAYCRSLRPEWLGEKRSHNLFLAIASIEILEELINLIYNINNHFPKIGENIFNNIFFKKALSNILKTKIENNKEILNILSEKKFEIINCVHDESLVIKITTTPKAILDYLIPIIQNSDLLLKNLKLKIFVDEFENLNFQQQKIINDYRKHSTVFQIWNVAHKEFANVTNETSGDEKLQELDDFKTIKMYEDLTPEYRKLLASEIIINIIQKNSGNINQSLNVLNDPTKLEERKTDRYKQNINNIIERIFPTPTIEDLCKLALSNTSCKKLIKNKFENKISEPGYEIDEILKTNPTFAIAHYLILDQRSFDLKKFMFYLKNPENEKSYKNKIDTYCYPALLTLNLSSTYINIPVYAGFDRFSKISTGNIRHVMLLVHYSLLSQEDKTSSFSSLDDFPRIDFESMQNGAQRTSKKLIEEIQNFTPQGRILSNLANRLGEIFSLKHKTLGQPEPEQNHFFIKSDFGDLPEEINSLISNAKCWKLLIEHSSSKDKDKTGSASFEYQLNPIYCPGFGISYRKMRRLELSVKDFETLYKGSTEEFQKFRKKYQKEPIEIQNNLSLI